MIPDLEKLIAVRFLLAKQKIRFVNIISIVSFIGITVGVAALVVVLSVFNGFGDVVTRVLTAFDPHIRLEKDRGRLSTVEAESLMARAAGSSAVSGIAPFVSGKVLLMSKSYRRVVFMKGVDFETIDAVPGLQHSLAYGTIKATEVAGGGSMILIGLTMADRLGAVVGDELTIIGPAALRHSFGGIPRSEKFRISGIFQSSNREYDANYAYVPIRRAQKILGMDGQFTGIDLRFDSAERAPVIRRELEQSIPRNIRILTWHDLHQALFSVMRLERWTAFILVSMIIIIATFNMFGSLLMSVFEKQRDVAVLKSMGMSEKRIRRVFMMEGMSIGVIGTIAGLVLGLAVVYLQHRYELFPLDTSVYIIPAIPVRVDPLDMALIAATSLGLTTLAAYIPAKKASSVQPSQFLRWE